MSLAAVSMGKEIAFMTALLAIFGAVEARQMRILFEHLSDDQYAKIMTRLRREGFVWYGSGGRYIAASEHAANYVDLNKSVMMFWAFISIRHLVQEISSGDGETVLTFMSGRAEYDLIYMDRSNHEEILAGSARLGAKIRRLFVVSDLSDCDGMKFRTQNDFILVVAEDGSVETYAA